MATLTRGPVFWLRHLRAEPNQYVLQYRRGKRRRGGSGLSFWFDPRTSSLAEVPVQDHEASFVLHERTVDLQDLSLSVSIRYRFVDPERAATRFNFTISVRSGSWTDRPLERLVNFFARRAQEPARAYLSTVPLTEAMTSAGHVREAIANALRDDPEVAEMGIVVVDVRVESVTPTSEMQDALATPARESLRQKADEAVFRRRADAVEKERAIQENELATKIELEHRQEQWIRRKGENDWLTADLDATASRRRTEGSLELRRLETEADAASVRTRATAAADARRARGEAHAESIRLEELANAEGERVRLEAWRDLPSGIAWAFTLQGLSDRLPAIGNLHLTPDSLTSVIDRLVDNRTTGGDS